MYLGRALNQERRGQYRNEGNRMTKSKIPGRFSSKGFNIPSSQESSFRMRAAPDFSHRSDEGDPLKLRDGPYSVETLYDSAVNQ